MIHNLFGFAEVRIFSLFLVMMSLWHHFLSHGFQICIFGGTLNELSGCQKHYNKVEKQNSIRINVFGYENGQPFPIHISKETFEDRMNLLMITEDEKKHYVLIKDFNAFMYNQTKHKEKKHFCMFVCNVSLLKES